MLEDLVFTIIPGAFRMENWHFLITGGSAGIGLAVARSLVASGAVVHLTGRREDALKAAANDLGSRAQIYPGDIGDAAQQKAMLAQVAENTGGRLDGLVVNAAKYGFESVEDIEPQTLEDYFRINCLSSVWLVQGALPLLEKGEGKSIVMISSTLAMRPVAGTAAYAATKAALNSLTKSFAIELAPKAIRCNAILPGVVDTPIHEPQGPSDPSREEKLSQLGPMHLAGRVGEPEEVAHAVVFLLSQQSTWTTGTLMPVDGGISLV